jgi:hypothetical protein
MKFYMAGALTLLGSSRAFANIHDEVLFSYYGESDCFLKNIDLFKDIFMDSGAFSAHTQGAKIDINEYADFINRYKNKLTLYANLDVMFNPEQTLKNQEILEKKGCKPLPVFHLGEDIKFLDDYCGSYDYIALGGIALPGPGSGKDKWLNDIFNRYPKHKFHGFGVGDLSMMIKYPFYSVDSSSWFLGQKYGHLIYPDLSSGHYNDITPEKLKQVNMLGFSRHNIEESYNARNMFNILSIRSAMLRMNNDDERGYERFNDVTEELK